MVRGRGRPQVELDRMDDCLSGCGGVRVVVEKMHLRGVPYSVIARLLEDLTGVRVCGHTVSRWLRSWSAGDALS